MFPSQERQRNFFFNQLFKISIFWFLPKVQKICWQRIAFFFNPFFISYLTRKMFVFNFTAMAESNSNPSGSGINISGLVKSDYNQKGFAESDFNLKQIIRFRLILPDWRTRTPLLELPASNLWSIFSTIPDSLTSRTRSTILKWKFNEKLTYLRYNLSITDFLVFSLRFKKILLSILIFQIIFP